MTIAQVINAIIIYSWLAAVLFFLWRHAIGAGAQSRKLMTLLADSNQKSAEAAHQAAEAALQLAELLRKRNNA